jgi:hypothetical protein
LPAVKRLFACRQTIVWLRANFATEHPLLLKTISFVPPFVFLGTEIKLFFEEKQMEIEKNFVLLQFENKK